MPSLEEILASLSEAKDKRKALSAELKDFRGKLKTDEGLSEEEEARLNETLDEIEALDEKITELREQESEVRNKQANDDRRNLRLNAAISRQTAPVGSRVPNEDGPIGGQTPEGNTQVNVQPPTSEQLSADLGTMIRAVALSNGNYERAPSIAKEMFKNDRVHAAMSAGDFSAGGAWIPENYVPQLIELLRPRSIVRAMGAANPPLVNGSLTLPKITSGASATYIGENQNINTTEQTGGQLVLRSKKLAALVPVSNDLLRYSNPSADNIIRNDLVRAMAVAEDAAFIRDDGSGNAPKGLRYWASTANVIAANSTVNLQNVTNDLGSLELALMQANVMMTNPGWMMAPRTSNYLRNLRDGNGNYAFPEMQRGMLRGYPYRMTTQIPVNLGGSSNESEIYFADFDEVIIAEDSRFELEASKVAAYHDGSSVVAAFSQDQTVIRVIASHDLGMRHVEAVAILNEVTWGE